MPNIHNMHETYTTSEAARIIGIHPNTVRLYEDLELIPPVRRQANGYRIFTEYHVEQMRLARSMFEIEVMQNGLRKMAIAIIKTSAAGNFDEAAAMTNVYIHRLETELANSEEAITSVKQILSGSDSVSPFCLRKKEAADYLGISCDTLRNWERNGLLAARRSENGYRLYTDGDMRILKVIRSLRCANYSLESILRMLNTLSADPKASIKAALDSPSDDSDIISVCDRLITSLTAALLNAKNVLDRLEYMKKHFSNPPF